MKKNHSRKLTNAMMSLRAAFLLSSGLLTLSAASVGCGRQRDAHKAAEPSAPIVVTQNSNTEPEGCKVSTKAICVIPGDEGECLAYSLEDEKICPETK